MWCVFRPEALGIVSGTVYLMCTIFSQLAFATNFEQVIFVEVCVTCFMCLADVLSVFFYTAHDL